MRCDCLLGQRSGKQVRLEQDLFLRLHEGTYPAEQADARADRRVNLFLFIAVRRHQGDSTFVHPVHSFAVLNLFEFMIHNDFTCNPRFRQLSQITS